MTGSRHALATVELADVEVCDLDDARQLLDLGVRPSQVVDRDYAVTQALALRVFETMPHLAGLSWWSFYNPAWTNRALWRMPVAGVTSEDLRVEHPAVRAAAASICRVVRR